MPRRLLSASLALLALVSLSQRSFAKPPDLPHNPVIVVQGPGYAPADPQLPAPLGNTRPEDGGLFLSGGQMKRPTPHMIHDGGARAFAIRTDRCASAAGWEQYLSEAILFNIHPLMHFLPPGHFTPVGAEEACEDEPTSGCPRGCGQPCDKHAAAIADLCATRTVMGNLRALQKADKCVRKAKKLMKRGRYHEAAECLARVSKLCPGAPCAREAEKMRTVALARAKAAEEAAAAEEEAEEPSEGGCCEEPLARRFRAMQQFGLCQFTAAAEAVGRLACVEAHCQPACFPGVEGKLGLPVSARFVGVPLEAALNQLGGTFGVPVVIEYAEMKANGVDLSAPVSMHVEHVPLRVALDMMLRPLGLEPVVKGNGAHIGCMPRVKVSEEACEPCPEARRQHEAHCAGVRAQVDGLIKACYLAVEAKRYAKAAGLARQAHALDPARVEADPIVYKMHLIGAEGCPMNDEPAAEPPATCPAGAAGEALPVPVVTEERAFDVPAERAACLDDRAFRGAGEKDHRLAAGIGWCLLHHLFPQMQDDHPGGCLVLGLPISGVNLYLKTPYRAGHVHIAVRGNLPLLWTTPAKDAE